MSEENKIRYTSWGSHKVYKWLWRAALQDAIFAFRKRMHSRNTSTPVITVERVREATKARKQAVVNVDYKGG